VVKVKLTPKSTMGLYNITPDLTITREKEAEVSVVFAINCLGDPNFLFIFSEEDRLELENANEQLLDSASIGLGVSNLTGKILTDTLLPPKIVPKKAKAVPKKRTPTKTTKTTKKESAKAPSKSSLL